MKFTEFWKKLSPREKEQLAKDANTSKDYLSQLANEHRRPGVDVFYDIVDADNRLNYEIFRK